MNLKQVRVPFSFLGLLAIAGHFQVAAFILNPLLHRTHQSCKSSPNFITKKSVLMIPTSSGTSRSFERGVKLPSMFSASRLSARLFFVTLFGGALPTHAASTGQSLMSTLQTPLLAVDQLLSGFSIGTTIWFFFIQSPFLLKIMGKEKFTPTMMKLIQLWVKTIFISVSALALMQPLLAKGHSFSVMKLLPLSIGWLAIAVNRFVIVPKALQAGWKSTRSRKDDDSKDIKEFAVQGGGKTETKSLHQTVVLFVLIMSGGLLGHMLTRAAEFLL